MARWIQRARGIRVKQIRGHSLTVTTFYSYISRIHCDLYFLLWSLYELLAMINAAHSPFSFLRLPPASSPLPSLVVHFLSTEKFCQKILPRRDALGMRSAGVVCGKMWAEGKDLSDSRARLSQKWRAVDRHTCQALSLLFPPLPSPRFPSPELPAAIKLPEKLRRKGGTLLCAPVSDAVSLPRPSVPPPRVRLRSLSYETFELSFVT